MNTLHPNHKWIICERDSSTTDSSTLDNSTLVSSTIERSTHWLIKSKLLCCSFSKLRTESDLWEHFPLPSVHTAHLCIRDICHFVDNSTIFNQNIWHQKHAKSGFLTTKNTKHALILDFLHQVENFDTCTACGACDKYQVCTCVSSSHRVWFVCKTWVPGPGNQCLLSHSPCLTKGLGDALCGYWWGLIPQCNGLNWTSALQCTLHHCPLWRTTKSGSFVNVSSYSGIVTYITRTSQELRMLSPSLCIQRSQCICSYCCSQLSEM